MQKHISYIVLITNFLLLMSFYVLHNFYNLRVNVVNLDIIFGFIATALLTLLISLIKNQFLLIKILTILSSSIVIIILIPVFLSLLSQDYIVHFSWIQYIISIINTRLDLLTYLAILTFSTLVFLRIKNKTYDVTLEDYKKTTGIEKYYAPCAIFLISLFFVFKLILIPIHFNGTYIDEYYHMVTASSLTNTGDWTEFTEDTPYKRGAIFTLGIKKAYDYLPNTVTVAKIIPLFLGILSFLLLYLITRRFGPAVTVPTLLLYSISLGVTLNHFYIRFFALYELVLLVSVYIILFDKHICSEIDKRITIIKTLLLTLISIGLVAGTNDNGAYMILLFNTIAILILVWRDYSDEIVHIAKNNALLKGQTIVTAAAIFTSFLTYVFFYLELHDKALSLFTFTSQMDFPVNLWGYTKIFFNDKLIITIFLFAYPIFAIYKISKRNIGETLRKKISNFDIAHVSFLFIFLLHMLSAKELQIFRGIFYLLPLIYFFSIFGLVTLVRSASVRLIIISTATIVFVAQYPDNFFTEPTIPRESVYIGGSIYNEITQNCNDAVIISSQFTYVLDFHGIKSDYYIQTNIHSSVSDGSIYLKEDKYYTAVTDTPVLKSDMDLLGVIQKAQDLGKRICYVERSPVIRLWLNPDTKDLIDWYFIPIAVDVNQKLFLTI